MSYFLLLPIPQEIVYHYIIPLVPKFHLSNYILQLQLKRIYLVKYIQYLFIDDKKKVMKDVWKHYNNEHYYIYESEYNYLYVDTSDFSRLNYLYLSF